MRPTLDSPAERTIAKGERSATHKLRWRRWRKAKNRVAKSVEHLPAESYARTEVYISALAAGIDLGNRELRRPEPPESPWCDDADAQDYAGRPMHPIDSAAWRWWQSLEEAQRMMLFEVEHYPAEAAGYAEAVKAMTDAKSHISGRFENPADTYGRLSPLEPMLGGWVVVGAN